MAEIRLNNDSSYHLIEKLSKEKITSRKKINDIADRTGSYEINSGKPQKPVKVLKILQDHNQNDSNDNFVQDEERPLVLPTDEHENRKYPDFLDRPEVGKAKEEDVLNAGVALQENDDE